MKINNLSKVILVLSLSLLSLLQSCGQNREAKVNTIIDSLQLIEGQRVSIKKFRIQPLKYEALKEEDRLRLIELDSMLTDQEIRRRIVGAFDEGFTDSEINDLYQFTTSPAFHKFFNSSFFNENLTNQFKDIEEELDRIEDSCGEVIESPLHDEPIPVDRKNGFYAVTADYVPNSGMDITLEEKPAITRADILEVEENAKDKSIDITFTEEGAGKFYRLTKNNIGRPIAIVIGKRIVSMPTVNQGISGGKANITGNFTMEEIRDMMRQLNEE